MQNSPISDLEIEAYLDGELDAERSLAVEHHLAQSPEDAIRVMADIRIRSALRLAQEPFADAPHLNALAEELEDRLLGHGRMARIFRPRRLAAGALLAAGVAATLVLTAPWQAKASAPTYVAEAVEAYQTSLLRAQMASQIESRTFNAVEFRAATRIRVPRLPVNWQITDVQLFPSDDGPALQIMVRTETGEPVSIFAVKSEAVAPLKPLTVRHGGASVAYWRNGDIAYALTGMEAPAALDLAAEDLADNRIE
jgi:anti-sigma factor RsiW